MVNNNSNTMVSKANASVLYTIASSTKSNAIKPQSYEGAVNAAEIFNQYLKLNDNFNADTEFKVVKVTDCAIIDAANVVVKAIDEITLTGWYFPHRSLMETNVDDVTYKNWRIVEVMKKHNLEPNNTYEEEKFINDVIEYMGGTAVIEKMIAKKKSAVAKAEIERLSVYVID